MDADRLQTLREQLQISYQRIERERMAHIPILNKALHVEAVGFREWESGIIGVMLTPWFMNLMLVPHEPESWAELEVLSKTSHSFPSGHYEFIVGEEAGIGKYQMCSLFSPVFEFGDQDTAVATAEAVMVELMDVANRCEVATHQHEIERAWHDDKPRQTDTGEALDIGRRGQDRASLRAPMSAAMSRRDMLRRALLLGNGAPD